MNDIVKQVRCEATSRDPNRGRLCVRCPPSRVTERIVTPDGHEWRQHPRFNNDGWSQCANCHCSKHVEFQSGWGMSVTYFPDPNTRIEDDEPPCRVANRPCTQAEVMR